MNNYLTYVVSKDLTIKEAYKHVREMFPDATIARYTKKYLYDSNNTMLFHDTNWYFEVILRRELKVLKANSSNMS